jgi:hypothetical protein
MNSYKLVLEIGSCVFINLGLVTEITPLLPPNLSGNL